MSINPSEALPFGPLEITEVYFEHDGPRFFAVRGLEVDIRFLAFCVDDGEETQHAVYLYLAMTPARLALVRSGELGLLQAFEESSPWQIWRVVEDFLDEPPAISATTVRLADIPNEDLPTRDAVLQLPTDTAPPLDLVELSQWAQSSMRTIAAIELSASGENLTEFPLAGLGAVGTSVQETLDALAQEESGTPTERGVIPKNITDDVQMSAMALRAASFVLVIGTDKQGGFTDNAVRVEATLERLQALITLGSTPEELVRAMQAYGSRARGKFTGLLRAVIANGSGIGVIAAPQTGAASSARMTAGQVRRAIASIDEVVPTENELVVRRGTLLGSNTRRRTFEIFDNASTNRYTGTVSAAALAQIDGLPVGSTSYVTAVLQEEVDFAAEDQETGRKYTLLSVVPLDD